MATAHPGDTDTLAVTHGRPPPRGNSLIFCWIPRALPFPSLRPSELPVPQYSTGSVLKPPLSHRPNEGKAGSYSPEHVLTSPTEFVPSLIIHLLTNITIIKES